MRLRFSVVFVLLAFLLMSGTAFSQTFTGLFDGYYAFNFNKPANQFNTGRAFDINHQMFSLNYAELSIEQKPKPVGYRFDIGFGDAASIVNASEPAGVIYQHVQQAYLTLNRDKMSIDVGKFVTPFGAEVIETKDNWNYSRGLLFTYAVPFYHFGVRTTYAASDKATVAAYVVNGWNNVRDNNRGKSLGVMATFKPIDKLSMTENYMVGNESPVKDNRRHTFDSIATYDYSKMFSIMGNFDYAFDSSFNLRRHWIGGAGYIKYSPNQQATGVKIVPRYEWFRDPEGVSGTAQTAQEGTITILYVSKESGSFWTEYRRDWSDQRVFSLNKKSGNVPRFNQDTLEFGYTYAWTHETK